MSVPSLAESHTFWYLPKAQLTHSASSPHHCTIAKGWQTGSGSGEVGEGGCEGAWTVLGSLISGSGCAYSSHTLHRFAAQNRNKRDVPQANKQSQPSPLSRQVPPSDQTRSVSHSQLINSRTSSLLTSLRFVHNEHTLKYYRLCSESIETNFLFFVCFSFFFLHFSSSSCISKQWVT